MPKCSVGLIMYRCSENDLEVFLVHPRRTILGHKKDKGAWSIPKGEYDHYEPLLEAAVQEFKEETGFEAGSDFVELGEVKQAGGKIVAAWSFENDCDAADLDSNKRRMEWPPHSGRQLEFSEADRGQ